MSIRNALLAGLVGGICALTACSTSPVLSRRHVDRARLASVRVVAAPDANDNSATALDLVLVYDASALPLLPEDATTWFKHKSSLVTALGTAIDVVALQVPPASVVNPVKLPERHARAVAVVAFALYLDPAGQPRLDLGGYRHVTVWLKASSVTSSEP